MSSASSTSTAAAPPPRAPLPLGIGRLFEPIYRAAVARRNRAFDRGIRVVSVGPPVISVGNISVGGTGKTPMVQHIVRTLLAADVRTAIAMRGYKAKPGLPSDEQSEHAAIFADVPIAVGADRVAAIREVVERAHRAGRPIGAIVLDDAFQHRFIKRALDIVLVDATRDPFTDRCLPAGWLREPVESLARAQAVVITHAEGAAPAALRALSDSIARVHRRAPLAITGHAWSRLETPRGPAPVAQLKNFPVVALCAIGNPQAFIAQLRAAGADVRAARILPDHGALSRAEAVLFWAEARRLAARAIITTEKDWTSFAPVVPEKSGAEPPIDVFRPVLRLDFLSGKPQLESAVRRAAGV